MLRTIDIDPGPLSGIIVPALSTSFTPPAQCSNFLTMMEGKAYQVMGGNLLRLLCPLGRDELAQVPWWRCASRIRSIEWPT